MEGQAAGRRRRWWAPAARLLHLRPCYKVAPRALSDTAVTRDKAWPADSSGGAGGGGGDAEAAERRDALSPLPSKTARGPLRTCGSLTAWQALAAEVADAEAAAAAATEAVGAAEAAACMDASAPALRALAPSLRCRASQIDPRHIMVSDDVEDDGAGEDECPHLRRTSSILRPDDSAGLAQTLHSLGGSSGSDTLSCGMRSAPTGGAGEARELGGCAAGRRSGRHQQHARKLI